MSINIFTYVCGLEKLTQPSRPGELSLLKPIRIFSCLVDQHVLEAPASVVAPTPISHLTPVVQSKDHVGGLSVEQHTIPLVEQRSRETKFQLV